MLCCAAQIAHYWRIEMFGDLEFNIGRNYIGVHQVGQILIISIVLTHYRRLEIVELPLILAGNIFFNDFFVHLFVIVCVHAMYALSNALHYQFYALCAMCVVRT